MPVGWFRRPPQPLAEPAPADELAPLRTALRDTVVHVNRSADRLPVGVVPRVRAIEDVLVELLDHEARTDWTSISAQARFSIGATITDYLPTSVNTYLALPPAYAATHRTPAGRAPDEELAEQLRLLDDAVRDLALAVYSGDAERLSTQGRFLDTKFAGSDLDLP